MKPISKAAIIKILLLLILLAILFVIVYNRSKIIDLAYPFFISFITAYLLNPLVTRMEDRGVKRSTGIIIIFLVFLSFLIFLCFIMVPALIRDMGKLMSSLPAYGIKFMDIVKGWQEGVRGIGLPEGIKNAIDSNFNRLQAYIASYLESVTGFIILALSKMFSIAIMPILVYYFLKDFNIIVEKASLIIPRKYRSQAEKTFANIDCVLGNYVRSQLILSGIIAVLTTTALLLLGIDFALVIGIINGITNIIPYFGPVIGAVPAVVIALLESPLKALYTIIVLTIIQQIESDLICPKLTSDSVGLHPLTVIFALFVGGELFGATGLIIGVPLVAAIKIIYRDIMKNLF